MFDDSLELKQTAQRWISVLLIALVATQSMWVLAEGSLHDSHAVQRIQSSLDDNPGGKRVGTASVDTITSTVTTGENDAGDCCQRSQCCSCHGSHIPLSAEAVRLSPTSIRHQTAVYRPDIDSAQPFSIYRPPIA